MPNTYPASRMARLDGIIPRYFRMHRHARPTCRGRRAKAQGARTCLNQACATPNNNRALA